MRQFLLIVIKVIFSHVSKTFPTRSQNFTKWESALIVKMRGGVMGQVVVFFLGFGHVL